MLLMADHLQDAEWQSTKTTLCQNTSLKRMPEKTCRSLSLSIEYLLANELDFVLKKLFLYYHKLLKRKSFLYTMPRSVRHPSWPPGHSNLKI